MLWRLVYICIQGVVGALLSVPMNDTRFRQGELLEIFFVFPLQNILRLLFIRYCGLFIIGVFGIVAGGAPNFITLPVDRLNSVGVGGNLPVDSAVFLGVYSFSETLLGLSKFGQ
jgi:hypothetical protein